MVKDQRVVWRSSTKALSRESPPHYRPANAPSRDSVASPHLPVLHHSPSIFPQLHTTSATRGAIHRSVRDPITAAAATPGLAPARTDHSLVVSRRISTLCNKQKLMSCFPENVSNPIGAPFRYFSLTPAWAIQIGVRPSFTFPCSWTVRTCVCQPAGVATTAEERALLLFRKSSPF